MFSSSPIWKVIFSWPEDKDKGWSKGKITLVLQEDKLTLGLIEDKGSSGLIEDKETLGCSKKLSFLFQD